MERGLITGKLGWRKVVQGQKEKKEARSWRGFLARVRIGQYIFLSKLLRAFRDGLVISGRNKAEVVSGSARASPSSFIFWRLLRRLLYSFFERCRHSILAIT